MSRAACRARVTGPWRHQGGADQGRRRAAAPRYAKGSSNDSPICAP